MIVQLDDQRLRADARRNRDQILLAARDVFIERGPDAALDEVARRAGVGNATLYRRFPDRRSLLRAVVVEVFRGVGDEARQALAEESDPFEALARYMHRALDLRIGAVMPGLIGLKEADQEVATARDSVSAAARKLVDGAHTAGALRPDVTEGDIGTMLIRLSRPLQTPLPPELDRALAHRHLDVLLDGLRVPRFVQRPLPGPAMSFDDLRRSSGG
jgi:AcrR family transcriptional regulator